MAQCEGIEREGAVEQRRWFVAAHGPNDLRKLRHKAVDRIGRAQLGPPDGTVGA
jgi:hypothetical protein